MEVFLKSWSGILPELNKWHFDVAKIWDVCQFATYFTGPFLYMWISGSWVSSWIFKLPYNKEVIWLFLILVFFSPCQCSDSGLKDWLFNIQILNTFTGNVATRDGSKNTGCFRNLSNGWIKMCVSFKITYFVLYMTSDVAVGRCSGKRQSPIYGYFSSNLSPEFF